MVTISRSGDEKPGSKVCIMTGHLLSAKGARRSLEISDVGGLLSDISGYISGADCLPDKSSNPLF